MARTSKNEPKMWENPKSRSQEDITVCAKETILPYRRQHNEISYINMTVLLE